MAVDHAHNKEPMAVVSPLCFEAEIVAKKVAIDTAATIYEEAG